jgi:hypothetical protein
LAATLPPDTCLVRCPSTAPAPPGRAFIQIKRRQWHASGSMQERTVPSGLTWHACSPSEHPRVDTRRRNVARTHAQGRWPGSSERIWLGEKITVAPPCRLILLRLDTLAKSQIAKHCDNNGWNMIIFSDIFTFLFLDDGKKVPAFTLEQGVWPHLQHTKFKTDTTIVTI